MLMFIVSNKFKGFMCDGFWKMRIERLLVMGVGNNSACGPNDCYC